MKVYVVTQYVDEERIEPIKVFDNRNAAESYASCFDEHLEIFEMDVENTNTCTPQYIINTMTHWNVSKVYCDLPEATWDIEQAIKDPYFHVEREDWNPQQKILLEVHFAVATKETGNSFAKLANDTITTANSMLETHSFEAIKQFIRDTLCPVIEEIRIKA